MKGRIALVLVFAFGLVAGAALTADPRGVSGGDVSPDLGAAGTVVVGDTDAQLSTGHWIVSESGVLAWTTDEAGAAMTPDAAWYADRAKALADLQREIECQMGSCDP